MGEFFFPGLILGCEQVPMDYPDCLADNVVTTVYQRRFYQLAGLFHKSSAQAVFAGFILYNMAITD